MATIRHRRPTAFELLAHERPCVVNSRPDWLNGLLMTLGAVLALGWIEANDRAVEEREARTKAEARLADVNGHFGPPIPPVVFVLEARTPQELEQRLAEIAGDADRMRYGFIKERTTR